MRRAHPLALLGRETRYVARLYLTQIVLVTCLILALVLALDLASRFDRVMSAQGVVALPDGAQRLAYYLGLRAAYNLPAILPIALSIGIVWTEFRLARLHERAMIANTGRAPLLSLTPALLVGLAVGLIQSVVLSDLRPLAVEAQASGGLRNYGARFSGGILRDQWLDFGDTIVRTTIRFDSGVPSLEDIRVFQFDPGGQSLRRIVWADGASVQGHTLALVGERAAWPAEAAPPARLPVEVNAEWLAWAGVDARFLPRAVLNRIAGAPAGVPQQGNYRAAWHERWSAIASGLATALLVASLCLHTLGERRGLITPLLIVALAYGLHITANVMAVLGENGHIQPARSAWSLPLAILAGTLLTVCLREARVRWALRPAGRRV